MTLKMQKQHTGQKRTWGHQINTEITKVMTFIQQTMQTLLVYDKKLKPCLNTDQTHLEIF